MAEAKRNSLKKVDSEKMAAGVYEATFNDGTVFSADLRDLPDGGGGKIGEAYDAAPAMVQRTLQYGIKQKLDDSMAGCETVEEAIEEVKSTWDAIVAGNWTIRVAGEGVEGGLFARAYAQFHNISLADAKAKISELVDKNLAAVREKITDAAKRDEVTERMIFNRIREVALERYPELKTVYDELKAKRASKAKSKAALPIDLD